MIHAKARAVFGPEGPFELTTIERRDLKPHDVLIEIKYAGICHSDIHTARGDWGPRSNILSYPDTRSPALSPKLDRTLRNIRLATE